MTSDLTTFLLRDNTCKLRCRFYKNNLQKQQQQKKLQYFAVQYNQTKESLSTHLWQVQALVCCCWLALIKQMILVISNRCYDLGLDHQVQINELFERCSHSPSALIEDDSTVKQSQANHSYIKCLFNFCTLLPFTMLGKWCYCLITEKAHENLASQI